MTKPRYQALDDARARVVVEKAVEELDDQPMWTLEQGIAMQREIEAAITPVGWHAALAGGVLRAGSSNHDLDIVVFPHCKSRSDTPRPNIDHLHDALVSMGMKLRVRCREIHASWRKKGGKDMKWVEVWVAPDGVRRVDLLVLS